MSDIVDSVFISYRQESAEFAQQVRSFAEKIRNTGIRVEFDQFERQEQSLGDPDEGWEAWCKKRTEAKCVLVVKSESWFEAASHINEDIDAVSEAAGGRGVSSEAFALAARLYRQRQRNDFLRFISLPSNNTEIPADWPQQSYDLEKNGEFELLLKWISKRLGLPLPGQDNTTVTKTIFVADASTSQLENRQRLVDHLKGSGWKTISPDDVADQQDDKCLTKSLEKCQAMVALIDDAGGANDALRQLRLANEVGIERVSFRESSGNGDFQFADYPAEWGTLLTGDFIEFCDNLVNRLESDWIQSERNIEAIKRPDSATNQVVLKIVDCTDGQSRPKKQIREWLEAMDFAPQGGTSRFQRFRGGDHISEHYQQSHCHGLLFVLDQSISPEGTQIEDLSDGILNIQTYVKEIDRQPFVGFLYWPPPGQVDWDDILPIDSVRFRKMCFDDATDTLPDFLEQLWNVNA